MVCQGTDNVRVSRNLQRGMSGNRQQGWSGNRQKANSLVGNSAPVSRPFAYMGHGKSDAPLGHSIRGATVEASMGSNLLHRDGENKVHAKLQLVP